ncbi:hypothetical protein [Thermomonas sp.]|uniref:hypothetical protein n=1 Tax=Thermomonas sp. TaxID=1971895 RepID=UPI0035B4496A
MSDIRNGNTSNKARARRIIKMAPMTRAVRSALAASALTLAIGFGGAAAAANPHALPVAHALQVQRPAIDFAPVHDLTMVAAFQSLGGINGPVASLIDTHKYGDVVIGNSDPINESGAANQTGISGYSDTGSVLIGNSGAITEVSTAGNAIGIYGYAANGTTTINNEGAITATSSTGLADAIFAYGDITHVANSGTLTVTGRTWAAGIEAQAVGSVTVDNTGAIQSTASSASGALGYGIYATGSDATVTNSGAITVRGYYATGIFTNTYGDTTITNDGAINAGTTTGSVLSWGINASAGGIDAVVTVDNNAAITAAGVYGAIGIQASSTGTGGTVNVDNSGTILITQNLATTGYGAYGILTSADGDATVYNSGNITANSKGKAFGIADMSFAGDADVTNTGNIVVTSTLNNTSNGATGILAFSANGGASVYNEGVSKATGVRLANGVDVNAYGDITVDNSGYIAALTTAPAGLSGRANGVKAISGGGDITINNSGEIYAKGRTLALSVYALANHGDITVDNGADGSIDFFSASGRGWGVWTYAAEGDITVDNAGYIGGLSLNQAYGVLAKAPQGDITVDNSGTINVISANSTARGVMAVSGEGTASVSNSNGVSVTSGAAGFAGTAAFGLIASGAYADVSNSGTVTVAGNTYAAGIVAQSTSGTTVTNTGGSISATAKTGSAFGIIAGSVDGDVVVDNASSITVSSQQAAATGIRASSVYGNVQVGNTAAISGTAQGNIFAIQALAGGDVAIDNAAAVNLYSAAGNAIGLYGYTMTGDVTVNNSGDISVVAPAGLADGIFASGLNVDVTNSGAIYAVGNSWAAGIEAQGAYVTTVQNDGAIDAIAVGPGGAAFGLYATGDQGVVLGNTGNINAQGYYATGIETRSNGDISVTNSGRISAGYVNGGTYYSALAVGINAQTGGVAAQVNISNSGDISALGYYGGTGISAVSSGEGGTVTVDNSGNLTVAQGNKYGYGAYGIFTSADGDSNVTNSGAITVDSAGSATGIAALSFAGNANVTNAGDINATSSATANNNATGILAFSANGGVNVNNGGSVNATSAGIIQSYAFAVNAQGLGDVTVNNTGSLYANGQKYAFGVYAVSGSGNVNVHNGDNASIGFSSYAGRGFGVFAMASQGDVAIDNDGTIQGYAFGQSVGVFAVAKQGNTSVDNSNTINVVSADNAAVGVFARADNGTASVTNSGDISAHSGAGSYPGDVAYGVIARGADALVYNSGSISASGYMGAVGVVASASGSATVNNTAGSIDASAMGSATGILANAYSGNATVNNASEITAFGVYLGGTGIKANSVLGDAVVSNTAAVTAMTIMGAATGISSYTIVGDAVISNTGAVTAAAMGGTGNAIGLYAYSMHGVGSITNSGAITAYSYGGLADGLFVSGVVAGVNNTGAIEANGHTWAAGIEAQGSAYVGVQNTGAITASAMPFVQEVDGYGNVVAGTNGGTAFGIYATGGTYGAKVVNSGNLTVQGGYATGIEVQSGGNLAVQNSGNIVVGSGLHSQYDAYTQHTTYYGTQLATGINAVSGGIGAVVGINNSGNITAAGISGASGISAVSSGLGGAVGVYNSGNLTIDQNQKYGYGAYGVFASADANATISNVGDITVTSKGAASGLTALSFAGNAVVVNQGDINVANTAMLTYSATGITAFSANGTAAVGNYGTVKATSGYQATAADVRALGDVTVINGGTLHADGQKYAFGVYATSGTGNIAVLNKAGADIGFYSYAGRGWGVFASASQGDVYVGNLGTIEGYAFGQSAGVFAVAGHGDTTVKNTNGISVISANNVAVGVFARADNGTATVVNSGDITAVSGHGTYLGDSAYGILARGDIAAVGNSGHITATGYYTATGIAARSQHGTTVTTAANSKTQATSNHIAIGIEGRAESGNVTVSSAGGITATGASGAVGIQGYSAHGNVVLGNTGHVAAASATGIAIGVTGYTMAGDTTVGNSALIEAAGVIGSYGILAQSYYGNVLVNNTATGDVEATGGATAIAILANAIDGNATVNNAGVVHAANANFTAAVKFEGVHGTNTLNNLGSGVISASGNTATQTWAVYGGDGVDVINNSGRILGAVSLHGGDDVFNNKAGGVWDLLGTTHSDFGDGNDTINNAVGGTILIGSGKVELGAGNDSLTNAGIIKIGTAGVISFGDGNDTATNTAGALLDLAGGSVLMGTGTNAFANAGTVKITGAGNTIDAGAAGTVTNTGLFNFLNGVTTDKLTVGGTLAGSGTMNIDVNLGTLTADQWQVNGSVAGTAVQTVNVQFAGMPTTANTKIDFAKVTGTSVAGNFVAGQYIGYNQNANFLNIGLGVTSVINAANTTADVFSISMDVTGLNDAGTLAASVATGAAGFLNSQVGTFRQRLGVNPYGDTGKVLSAFVRFYNDQGDMRPGHVASNFGQGGHFNYNQSSWGREVGVNANLADNFHAGLVLGNADSRQRLTDGGVGENRMDGMTVGGYATWYVPNGFYVDLTARQMAVDIRALSVAGVMNSRAHTSAMSLEGGYEWHVGGMNVVPQAQYTRTRVSDIRTFSGDRVDFIAHGGTFTRGRLGVELNKTFQMGDVRWTPYGSVNVIRDGGTATYTVGSFYGGTDTKGTSAMAELGVGVQKGGLGFTLGANWTDGGAYKSFVGAQANIRFSW